MPFSTNQMATRTLEPLKRPPKAQMFEEILIRHSNEVLFRFHQASFLYARSSSKSVHTTPTILILTQISHQARFGNQHQLTSAKIMESRVSLGQKKVIPSSECGSCLTTLSPFLSTLLNLTISLTPNRWLRIAVSPKLVSLTKSVIVFSEELQRRSAH